jgi:hypothetical protein
MYKKFHTNNDRRFASCRRAFLEENLINKRIHFTLNEQNVMHLERIVRSYYVSCVLLNASLIIKCGLSVFMA